MIRSRNHPARFGGRVKAALLVGAAFALWECGGNAWTDADTKAALDAVRAQNAIVTLCDGDGGCTPGQVRAVERATSCNLSSMMVRHGVDASAPAGCQPQ